MKKGQIYEGNIVKTAFPNRGIVTECRPADGAAEGGDPSADGRGAKSEPPAEGPGAQKEPPAEAEPCRITVKNTLPGQRVRFSVRRCRNGIGDGRLLEVTERSPLETDEPACRHFAACGGCSYQTLPYSEQLRLKEMQVLDLLEPVVPGVKEIFEGVRPSPEQFGYRNKMEFTFGDAVKDGPLTLGLHRRESTYDIVPVEDCRIVDGDFRKIRTSAEEYFRAEGIPYYHRTSHEGYLRHLLVRKAARTGEILVDLITTTQSVNPVIMTENKTSEIKCGGGSDPEETLLSGWRERLLALDLEGSIAGILHTRNDRIGDVVADEGTEILYGRDFFIEKLMGLSFRITPFSFFQTNSPGAEVLYGTARDMIGSSSSGAPDGGSVVFDLYSGTGTIAQMLAPAAKKVVGVEIVEEAVEAARENAAANSLDNCEFIAGDVLKVLDDLAEKPDLIVLDPPRDGIHPKALKKIIDCGAPEILYISCKPTSLARDLAVLTENGYHLERICCVDMFPGTVHIETVARLSR